ncbi:MAG TPA: nucleotidyltransferase family protein [Burkholderiales bacterium]
MPSIAGVLLAAGESRRFGGRKLLHALPGGGTIGKRSAAALAAAVDRAVAVLAPDDAELAEVMRSAGLEVCCCPDAREGMGASLACGVRATADADGWVVALADMPYVKPATIAAVADALRSGAALAAPVHAGRRGHPVGFTRTYYRDLIALSGDEGARRILQRDAAHMRLLPVDDPGIHRDIDTPDDIPPC